MPRKGAVLEISITAGTAQLFDAVNQSNAKIAQFGQNTKNSMVASSAALRELEGNFANNNRAIARFLANTIGLGPAMQALFPLVGGLAFGTMLFELGGKVVDFFKGVREQSSKISEAFRELNAPLRATNDELAVTNARLENDIAKLEGKRQNTLKLALAEAKQAADGLADSLDKDLNALLKLMKAQGVGSLNAFFTGRLSTAEDQKDTEGFAKWALAADRAGAAAVRAAKTPDEVKTANKNWNEEILAGLDAQIQKYKDLVKARQRLQDLHEGKLDAPNMQAYWEDLANVKAGKYSTPKYGGYNRASNTPDSSVALNEAQGTLDNYLDIRDKFAATADKTALTAKKEGLEADRSNNRSTDLPFEKKMAELRAQAAGLDKELGAVGQSHAMKDLALAAADADKAIAAINVTLKARNEADKRIQPALTKPQEGDLRSQYVAVAGKESQLKWKNSLQDTTDKIKDQIQTQEDLTAAIGKGYEAIKQLNVETEFANKIGAENYQDPARRNSDEAQAARALIAKAHDAAATAKSTEETYNLNQQIKLETLLAQVQIQGAEAVRMATLQFKLEQLAKNGVAGATRLQIQAELDLYAASRKNEGAAELKNLNDRIDAIKRVTAAQIDGAEAVRKAELEAKYAKIREQGGPLAVGMVGMTEAEQKAREEDEAAHQSQISGDARKLYTTYGDQLFTLQQQRDVIVNDINKAGIETIDQARALLDIENKRLQLAVQQALAGRTAADGVRAFFLEMQESAKSAAEIVYETLNSALDKVSDQFAKLITRQKTSFGQMLKGLGEDMLKSTIKSGLQHGLGALGKVLNHGKSPSGKVTFKKGDPGHVIVDNMGSSPSGSGEAPETEGLGGILGISTNEGSGEGSGEGSDQAKPKSGVAGGLLKILGSILGSFGGGMAGGGDVSPGKSYLVGEHGPEILKGASGRVHSNSESRRMLASGGDNHYYNIDARGTDPVQTEMRVRNAIFAAHQSAIGTGVQVQADRLRRVPQGA